VDAVQELIAFGVFLSHGTDDRDEGSCLAQCTRFLPHPPIERHRQILDDDENLAAS
jgi:hypothetical protein